MSQLLVDALTALGEPRESILKSIRIGRQGAWVGQTDKLHLPASDEIQLVAVRMLDGMLDAEVHTAKGSFISGGDVVTFQTGSLPITFVDSLEGRIFGSIVKAPLLALPVNRVIRTFQIAGGNFTLLQIEAPAIYVERFAPPQKF